MPLVASLGLAGCGMGALSSGLGSFGGSSGEPVSQPSLLTDAAAGGAGNCPAFFVGTSDQTLTKYADGMDNDARAVVYRGEITKTARECRIDPGMITVKYGFSGQVLLGPKGVPGVVSLPLSVALNDPSGNKVQAQPVVLSVEISPEKPIGYFSSVQTFTFPIAEGSRPADFKLVVAFVKEVPAIPAAKAKKKV